MSTATQQVPKPYTVENYLESVRPADLGEILDIAQAFGALVDWKEYTDRHPDTARLYHAFQAEVKARTWALKRDIETEVLSALEIFVLEDALEGVDAWVDSFVISNVDISLRQATVKILIHGKSRKKAAEIVEALLLEHWAGARGVTLGIDQVDSTTAYIDVIYDF